MENKEVKYSKKVSLGETREIENKAQSINKCKNYFQPQGHKSPAEQTQKTSRRKKTDPHGGTSSWLVRPPSTKRCEAEEQSLQRPALTGDKRQGMTPSKKMGAMPSGPKFCLQPNLLLGGQAKGSGRAQL